MSIKEELKEIKLLQEQLNRLKYNFNTKYHGKELEFANDWLKNNHIKGDHSFKLDKVCLDETNCLEYIYLPDDIEDIDEDDMLEESMHIEQFIKYVSN